MVRCVLIIDANQDERRWLEQAVGGFGYPVLAAPGAGEALEAILAPGAPRIALALFNAESASESAERSVAALMEKLGRTPEHPPVVALAPAGASGAAARIIRAGAADVVSKPISAERLEIAIVNVLKISALERELDRSRRRPRGLLTLDDIAANSDQMRHTAAMARRAAGLAVPMLLEGEPGTGKETFARAIHGASARAGGPFVCVNCAAISPRLIEETLFGSSYAPEGESGGKFAEAAGGSLFLEEPGELPPRAQERLWGLLKEEGAGFFSGGPNQEAAQGQEHGPEFLEEGGGRRTDVRLIAAASHDLIGLARSGAFREDLYMRLNAFPILIPPLRERMDDMPELVESFIARFSAEEGKRIDGAAPEALELIRRYGWPGNVRQLENAVYRAVVLAEGSMLTVSEFPQIAAHVEGYSTTAPAAPAFAPRTGFAGPAMIGSNFPITQTVELPSGRRNLAQQPPNQGPGQEASRVLGIPALNEQGDVRPLDAVEADMIRLAVGHYRGHMTEVARKLGIGRSTLYRKLREIGVDAEAH
jgi:DNA-binding NtrC family response regulator